MENNNDKEFNAGERLYIGKTVAYEPGVKEHFDRYDFAKKYLRSDFVVLDAACGTGYGSEILSKLVSKVVGLEISDHALDWARGHHQKTNIEFKKANLNKTMDLPSDYFDAIISFETLEHVENQGNMLSEFKRVLKPGGVLIISSPDREIITEKGGTDNKFHINELSKKELVAILKQNFKLEDIYGQTRYVMLPWYKKIIKLIAKLDIFKIRRKIVQFLKLNFFFHKHLAPMAYSSIEKVEFDSPNNYYVLIAVCRK